MNLVAAKRPRQGDWMQTYTGRQFWPLDPEPAEIDILDIAHSLSMQCRYAGHCRNFYSVAEHCVLLSLAVEPEHAFWALMHDASEAYLVDIPRPVKPALVNYRNVEDRMMLAICARFGLAPDMPRAVKEADNRILADEAAQNMSRPPVPWADTGAPLGVTLQFWTPAKAQDQFMARFREVAYI